MTNLPKTMARIDQATFLFNGDSTHADWIGDC